MTQSISGLMSAKDKVKLDNTDTTYLQSAGSMMRGEIQRSGSVWPIAFPQDFGRLMAETLDALREIDVQYPSGENND